MSDGDLRADLVRQRNEAAERILALEGVATAALLGRKEQQTIDQLQTEILSLRERIRLLDAAIMKHDQDQHRETQARMLAQTMAFIKPLVEPLDRASSELLLPPHVPDKPVHLEPDTVPKRTSFRWPGNRQGDSNRWNQRLR